MFKRSHIMKLTYSGYVIIHKPGSKRKILNCHCKEITQIIPRKGRKENRLTIAAISGHRFIIFFPRGEDVLDWISLLKTQIEESKLYPTKPLLRRDSLRSHRF